MNNESTKKACFYRLWFLLWIMKMYENKSFEFTALVIFLVWDNSPRLSLFLYRFEESGDEAALAWIASRTNNIKQTKWRHQGEPLRNILEIGNTVWKLCFIILTKCLWYSTNQYIMWSLIYNTISFFDVILFIRKIK